MNMPDRTELGQYWNAPSYVVKVRGLKYLWGSSGLLRDVVFEKAFILHIANDLSGDPVRIGTQVADGIKTEFGTLQPGECISLSVNNISGIYADCNSETLIHCTMD